MSLDYRKFTLFQGNIPENRNRNFCNYYKSFYHNRNKGKKKMKRKKLKLSEFDDDALEILYHWANCAILAGTAQVQQMITPIIAEYEARGLRK